MCLPNKTQPKTTNQTPKLSKTRTETQENEIIEEFHPHYLMRGIQLLFCKEGFDELPSDLVSKHTYRP